MHTFNWISGSGASVHNVGIRHLRKFLTHVSYNKLHIAVLRMGKTESVHAMMEYRESRGTAPLILNLGTRWR
jgi:hypothetical protein